MPNFGGSRGGFWFRPPSVPTGTVDRSTSSKRILIVKEYGEKTAQFPRGRLYGVYGASGWDGRYTHSVLIEKYPYVTVPNSSDIYASTKSYKNPRTNKIDTYVFTDDLSAHAFAIKTCAEELGYTVDIITCHDYDALGNLASQLTNINTYSQIWDLQLIGFLNTTAKNIYKTFLQAGGSLFLTGENRFFGYPGHKGPNDDRVYWLRNDDICTFVRTDLGGGEVYSSSSAPYYWDPSRAISNISSEFRLFDVNMTSYTFNLVGAFSSYRSKSNNAVIPYIGTGTVIVQLPPGFYQLHVIQGETSLGTSIGEILIPVTQGAMWKTGSLANAPAGACMIIFDSTFQQPQYLAGTGYITNNAKMIKNMILSLNSK